MQVSLWLSRLLVSCGGINYIYHHIQKFKIALYKMLNKYTMQAEKYSYIQTSATKGGK